MIEKKQKIRKHYIQIMILRTAVWYQKELNYYKQLLNQLIIKALKHNTYWIMIKVKLLSISINNA